MKEKKFDSAVHIAFRYEDVNNEVVLIDMEGADTRFEELLFEFGFSSVEFVSGMYKELGKEDGVWELQLPFMDGYLVLAIYDFSKEETVSQTYLLCGSNNQLTEYQSYWILEYISNIILYQDTTGIDQLKLKLLWNEPYDKETTISEY